MAHTHVNFPIQARTAQRYALTFCLTLMVVLSGLLPALAPTARAQTGETFIAYIPWVPHKEFLDGQGPWYGIVSYQNLTEDSCPVEIFANEEGAWKRKSQAGVGEGGSRSISSTTLALKEPGSPVRLEAACELAVSVKEYMPNARSAPWSDGAQVVTGYTGLSESDLAAASATATTAWFLPIVQTNSDWNTFIRVANLAEATATDVTIEIYPAGNVDGVNGAAVRLERHINVAEAITIDTLAEIGSAGFIGFARITASDDIGVVARRVKPGAGMAISNVGVAADGGAASGEYRTVAPLLFNAYNGWNTGITMANASDQPAVVTIQYFPIDGEMLREESIVIAARSMSYIYTPGTVTEEGFVGSANILSNRPIIAAVDEVKYETSEALSYMASGAPQHAAGIPIVFKEAPLNGRNDNSGISVVNLDPVNPQNILLRLRDRAGVELLDLPIGVRLPAGGSSYVYLPFIDEVPAGTNGSILIETSSPAGVVAISNDINYAAGSDGSVVFLASGNGGIYFVPAPAP